MKNYKYILLTIIVLIAIAGIYFLSQLFEEKNPEPNTFELMDDTYTAKYSASELAERLENAYSTNSNEEVNNFFEEWHSSVPPNSPEFENQNPTIKDVYDIYRTLFITENTEHIRPHHSQYLIIQQTISYWVEEQIALDDGEFAIMVPEDQIIPYFRPSIDIAGKKMLYLTNEYKDALMIFLNNDTIQRGQKLEPNETMKRYYFINQYIPILLREGRFWILDSPPYTDGFYFGETSPDSVRFGFGVEYHGFSANAKRTQFGWVIEDRKVTSVI